MKSKITLLLLAVFVIGTCLTGCRRIGIKAPDQSIPFLTLVPDNANGESIKKAILNFWDLKNGKIIKTDKVIYTVIPTTDIKSEQAFYEGSNGDRPLYWDGKDCIIFPWFFKSETNLYNRTETITEIPEYKEYKRIFVFGKDVEMVRIPTGDNHNYKYTVKLWDGVKYIEKELNLNYEFQDTNSQPSYPVAIGNDETNLNILISGGYNSQTGMDLFLCTVDKKDWISKWYKISVENNAGIGPSNPPFSSNSIYFDGSFYLPSGCCGIAKVDIEERICRRWKKIITSKPSEEDIGYSTSILGSFNDTIIVQFTVLKGPGNEHYICVFKNEEGVGMMHLVNGNLDVMDKDGNILSSTTLNENSSIVFPRTNGEM